MKTFPSVLNYNIRKGNNTSAPHPALILLHGYGSNKDDLFSFASYLPQEYSIIALEAPYQLMHQGFAWYALHLDAAQEKWSDLEQARKSLIKVRDHLKYCISSYNIDPKAISLLGFSQGAIMSWALKLNYPEEFDRIIGLSGYINIDLIEKPIAEIRNINGFASHGIQDMVLPIGLARQSVGKIAKENPQLVYKEYSAGHTIGNENFTDLLQWINQSKKI